MTNLSRRKILDAIRTSNCPQLFAFGERLMKGEFEMDEQPKEDPRHDSVYQRLEALEHREAFWKQDALVMFHDRLGALERGTADLEKKVKALEDQHREITPDAEKYICIDLGYPFKKVYFEKPSEK